MPGLRIALFGRFRVTHRSTDLSGFDSSKALELFCYLLLNRGRNISRDVLGTLLWDHCTTSRSKAYLRKALWKLHTALEPCAEAVHVLDVDSDWIGINPNADLWLDVEIFERAFMETRGLTGAQLDEQSAQVLAAAASLYTSDLLENMYHDWCLGERERLQHMYLEMLDKLIDYCLRAGKHDAGLLYGSRVLSIDRAHERTHRRLMQLHMAKGDRTSALRQYAQCAEALQEELNIQPARVTVELNELLREDGLDTRLNLADPPPDAAGASATVRDRLRRIKDLHEDMLDLYAELRREIIALEASVGVSE